LDRLNNGMSLPIVELWLGKISKLLAKCELFQALTEAGQGPETSRSEE
jgi:hypothetical protein